MELIDLTKVCSTCNQRKNWKKFNSKKSYYLGIYSVCKLCVKNYNKTYSEVNKEKIKHYKKNYNVINKNKIKEIHRLYYQVNKDKRKIIDKEYYQENKERILKYNKKYRKKNKNKIKEYLELNKDKRKIYSKAYNKIYSQVPINKHKKQINDKIYSQNHRKESNVRAKKRREENPMIKLNQNIRNFIGKSLRNNKNGMHWETIVGYTLEQLKKHIKKQFTENMSWKNYGRNGWHIDHRIPLSVFNFTKPEHRDFQKAWALSNLQPMWEKENISKGAKLTKHFQPSLLL